MSSRHAELRAGGTIKRPCAFKKSNLLNKTVNFNVNTTKLIIIILLSFVFCCCPLSIFETFIDNKYFSFYFHLYLYENENSKKMKKDKNDDDDDDDDKKGN